MGASSSTIGGEKGVDGGCYLGELPESCVASVLIHLDLDPPEICGLARLNRAFRGAAASDLVWDLKLPPNYEYLVKKAGEDKEEKKKNLMFSSKKEIYAHLCKSNPFDGGTKMFWLEKKKGGVCMLLSSKALMVTGIDDRRYWNYIPTEESRFGSVAYLQQIWWFEVDGEIEFCFPAGTYVLYFRLHLGRSSKRLGRRICNIDHVHGWDIKPVKFRISTSNCGGQDIDINRFIETPGTWLNYCVGEFVVDDSDVITKVKFSMTQIDCTHTKGGLCLDSVLICPKDYNPN